MIQLLFSPSIVQQSDLLVDPHDLDLLPVSTTISFILPTVGLCLPLLTDISREAKYIAIALWQPFPLYQSAILSIVGVFKRGTYAPTHGDVREWRRAMDRAYSFITTLTMSIHLTVMAIILASSVTHLIPKVSGQHILALTSLTNPPTLELMSSPVSALESREIVVSFLRWDVYCTCISMVIWSTYQLMAAQRAPNLAITSMKVVFWALLGGPIFPALMLLWERDDIVMDRVEYSTPSQKKGR